MGKLSTAARSGDRRQTLVELRNFLAKTLETTNSARDIASISKRLMEVTEELEALPDPEATDKSPIERQREKIAKRRGEA